MVPLTPTVPEVCVVTMTTVIHDPKNSLEETLNYLNIIKLKRYAGENVADFFSIILVDSELHESSRAFDPEHLGYITRILENTSNSRFRFW